MRGRRHRGEAQPAVPSWLLRRGEHVPSPRTPEGDSARIAALAHDAGAPVRDVLREVADFRLALETDMIIAAAACEAHELGLVGDVLDGERAGLAAFQQRMLSHLNGPDPREHAAEVAPIRPARAERMAGRARLVAAAAALVALVGGGISVSDSGPREDAPSTEQVALALADEQLSTLTGQIVRSASSADITVAATELHATLDALIAQHAEGDPEVAEMIAELIREEQQLLVVDKSSARAGMLADVARLVRKLKRKAPAAKIVATLPPVAPPASSASPTPKASASAKPSPTPSPTSAAPSPSASPRQSSSASPSSGGSGEGDSGGNPIPTAGP